MGKLSSLSPALAPTRAALLSTTSSTCFASRLQTTGQVRHATYIYRPRRPYRFTQLVQLTDGSAYYVRTMSPQPIYKPNKDTRNTLTWQPSEKSLKNIELDEAGKLAAFRERFGRGFDAAKAPQEGEEAAAAEEASDDAGYADLITGYVQQDNNTMRDSGPKKSATRRK